MSFSFPLEVLGEQCLPLFWWASKFFHPGSRVKKDFWSLSSWPARVSVMMWSSCQVPVFNKLISVFIKTKFVIWYTITMCLKVFVVWSLCTLHSIILWFRTVIVNKRYIWHFSSLDAGGSCGAPGLHRMCYDHSSVGFVVYSVLGAKKRMSCCFGTNLQYQCYLVVLNLWWRWLLWAYLVLVHWQFDHLPYCCLKIHIPVFSWSCMLN